MVLKTKKAKHLSLQPEFPCTEQTSERETSPEGLLSAEQIRGLEK